MLVPVLVLYFLPNRFGEMADDDTSANVDILLEFLEVAIHNILYVRNLYPSGIFTRRRKYGIPVQMSFHPQVNEYIRECLRAVKELLETNGVKQISLVFFNKDLQPIERYVFFVLENNDMYDINDPYLIKGEEAFRGYCLKLQTVGKSMKPLPEGSTFTVQIHTSEAQSVKLSQDPRFENFPWMEAENEEVYMEKPRIVPIKTMDTGYLQIQMYLEKSH